MRREPNATYRLMTFDLLRYATIICCTLAGPLAGFAKPRPPVPPLPERQLWDWHFDDLNWIYKPTSNAVIAQNLALAESWSGYALDMSGNQPSALVLPMLSGASKPYLSANAGTVRFWFSPNWGSASGGGAGPGGWARLFEVGNPVDALEQFWITLAIDPAGDILTLAGTCAGCPPFYLRAGSLQWQANGWHEIAIVYSPTNTMLVVDGSAVASTANGLPWPAPGEWPHLAFALGSGLDGQDIARGQLEELTTFSFPVSLEYLAWHYQQFAPLAALGPITEAGQLRGGKTMEMMTSSEGPPVPGPGGGGGGTNPPPYLPPSPPGLKLTRPLISGSVLTTTLAEADTNNAHDIFQKLGLQPTNTWSRVAMGDIGQTNFSLSVPSTNHAFFIAAAVVDSDFDGLPDAYEELVLHTSPLSADTNGDGIPDGNGDLNGNGLPDYVDYNGLTRVVVFATRPTAYEGGQAGEIAVRLPSAAPTNNTKITLHLGGLADYDGDYWLTKPNGSLVTNDLFFAMGEREIRLQVVVNNDSVQSSIDRKVQIALESSANYQLDPQRADVVLVDDDLPTVSIFATDSKAGEPKGTNTNPGLLTLRRDGRTTNALSVRFAMSGSASNGVDYTSIVSPITIPVGSNTVTIPVNPVHDTNYEGDETVIATLQTDSAYVISPEASSATVALADNDLPLLNFVGTDLVATEYNNLKASTVTVTRSGNTAKPLTFSLAIGGTATNGVDYQNLTNVFTFPTNASNIVINVRPLADTLLEQAETVILTLKGSLAYEIGSSNSVTVFIDDSNTTSYEVVQIKQSSAYDPIAGVDIPSVIELRRFGRSSNATNIGFAVNTNTTMGPKPTTFYHVDGDFSGTNAVLAPFATKARLNFRASVAVPQEGGGVDVRLPHTNDIVQSVFFQPAWQGLYFSVIDTNAVEGGSAQARVRLSRRVAGPAMTALINVSGQAKPAGFFGADHLLPEFVYMTLGNNVLSVETNLNAIVDGGMEGWESVVFKPRTEDIQFVFEAERRYMAFIRENAANPELLPNGDYDGDGLPDRWELANGFDPFTPGEETLDRTKTGSPTWTKLATTRTRNPMTRMEMGKRILPM